MTKLRLAAGVLVAVFALARTASAERIITSLPHQESFDAASSYPDLVWVTQGCTHTFMPGAGWRGGAAKFTPPSAEGACGLGQFILSQMPSVPEQVNLRFLIFHGSTWREYGPGNKLVIMNREGNRGRPMIITRKFEPTDGSAPWETWGACDGTVCRYLEGDYWPLGGDTLRIGDAPNAREKQWISVELEANTRTGMIRLYVDTLDGALKGKYVERPMDDTGPGGTWSYIDLVGGYMAGAVQSHPENYFMIDELAIDSKYIGPPPGFGSGAPSPAADAGSDGGAGDPSDGGPSGAEPPPGPIAVVEPRSSGCSTSASPPGEAFGAAACVMGAVAWRLLRRRRAAARETE